MPSLSWEDLTPETRARLIALNPGLLDEEEPEEAPLGALVEIVQVNLAQPVLPQKRFEIVLGEINWGKVALFIGFLLLAFKY